MTPTVIDFSVLDVAITPLPKRHQKVTRKGKGKNMADMTAVEKLKAAYDKAVEAVNGGKGTTQEKQNEIDSLTAKYEAEKAALETNEKRTGKGTRLAVSSTRGRNTQPVTYEAFDENQPDTLPESVAEFVSLTGIDDEAMLVSFLVTGYNDNSFRIASDPVQEFVNPAWSTEVAASFKAAVKQLVKSGIGDIETVVNLIKPSVDAKFASASQA